MTKAVTSRCILLVAAALVCAGVSLGAEEVSIQTYPFTDNYEQSRFCPLSVGPDGNIWFGAPSPARLMRISGDLIQVVANEGFLFDWASPRVLFAPDGALWMSQSKLFYAPPPTYEVFAVWLYLYDEAQGVRPSNWTVPVSREPDPPGVPDGPFFAPEGRMYYLAYTLDVPRTARIYRLTALGPIEVFWQPFIGSPLLISNTECWANVIPWDDDQRFGLCKMNLLGHYVEERYLDPDWNSYWCGPRAIDDQGRVWLDWHGRIGLFDHGMFTVFAEPEHTSFWAPTLTADGTVWWVSRSEGLVRWKDGAQTLFTSSDGLLSDYCAEPPVIDYDGRVWVLNFAYEFEYQWAGISRITDGGWPPMRLSLNKMETPGAIVVEANVINNGPVVGVDVYIALQLGDQLLFYPTWGPEPFPNQVNLRPGHNQTATIIELPKAQVPPGSYTFWGCMTGRNTQKLIGPIGRKFESLTVEVNG